MGREIKRVPIGFDYKLDKVWAGYINPYSWHGDKCLECDGSGYSKEYKHLSDLWYGNAPFNPEDRGSKPFLPTDEPVRKFAERNVGRSPEFYGNGEMAIQREAERLCKHWNSSWSHHLNEDDVKALIKADRLWDFTRTPRTEEQIELVKKRVATGKHNSWLPESNGYIPTPQEVNVWSISGMGHDACNQWACVKAECKRLGYKYTCEVCNGSGEKISLKYKKLRDEWKRVEPPKGIGFQLWETVSEGSPISPVFETPEELATWLVESPDYKWKKNDAGTTYEQWLSFISVGWAMSGAVINGTYMSGVQAVSQQ